MKTGIASVFCETWLPTPGARQTSASGRSQVSQIRTKRRIRQYPSNRESLFESDHADEALASICQKYRPICAARSFRVKGLESNRLAGIFRIHGSNLCTRPEVSDSNQVNSARAS